MKIYHIAKYYSNNGGVSALCFLSARPINLERALWTIRKEAVTCKKCLKLIKGEK